MKITSFARELGFDRKRIYSIFNSKSIDTDLLVQISKILDYNFLIEYFGEEKPFMDNIVLVGMDNSRIAEIKSDSSVKIIKSWASV